MRGAFTIPGGTAEQVRDAMESKLFRHGRRIIATWKYALPLLHFSYACALGLMPGKLAPRGMVLVEWDADPDRDEPVTYVWYLLDPRKWNGKGFDGHRAWRWHPDELAKILQPARSLPAKKRAR